MHPQAGRATPTPSPRSSARPVQARGVAWLSRCLSRGPTAPLRGSFLATLAAALEHHHFTRGDRLFDAGDMSRGVWLVCSGAVELSVRSGRRSVVVDVLRPRDVDGDLQLLRQLPMGYTGRAAVDTDALFLPGIQFWTVLREHPTVALGWLTSLATRLGESHQRLADLLELPLSCHLAKLLLAESIDGTVPLRQETLAAMLGVRRPSLNRVLATWSQAGWVSVGYGQVEILDADQLARLARG